MAAATLLIISSFVSKLEDDDDDGEFYDPVIRRCRWKFWSLNTNEQPSKVYQQKLRQDSLASYHSNCSMLSGWKVIASHSPL